MHELQSKSDEKKDTDSTIWSDTISDIEKIYITNFDRQEFFKVNNVSNNGGFRFPYPRTSPKLVGGGFASLDPPEVS